MNSTTQDFSVEDTKTDDSYFNISEIKLSITSLYVISDTPQCDIIWTENSDVIDSFYFRDSTNRQSLYPRLKNPGPYY